MNRQFPALSGIAMLLIVLNHTIDLDISAPLGYGNPHVDGLSWMVLSILQSFGIFAVPIFLFISGTFVSYAAKSMSGALNWKFVARSLGHICWPYVIWSALFYLLLFLQFRQQYRLDGYVKNLVVGYPFHFVPLLIFFYLISPLLVRFSRRRSGLLIAVIAAYQLCLVILSSMPEYQGWMKAVSPPIIRSTLAQWAVFFPFGLVYGMHLGALSSHISKLKWLLLSLAVGFFVLDIISWGRPPYPALFRFLSTAAAVTLLPLIDRKLIPGLHLLENVGKRAYGLYFSHLIVLDLTLYALASIKPWVLDYRIAILPFLYYIAIQVPMLIMNGLAKSPGRAAYRYIFG